MEGKKYERSKNSVGIHEYCVHAVSKIQHFKLKFDFKLVIIHFIWVYNNNIIVEVEPFRLSTK